jgi:rhomboid protease GluP
MAQVDPDPSHDWPDWIESLVKAAAALGMNPIRVRWKLIRSWQAWRRFRFRLREKLAHVRYPHKTCPRCGAVQDRLSRICSSCGRPLSSRAWQVLERIGLTAPRLSSVSAVLGVFMVLIYGRMILAQGGGGILSLEITTLLRFGGHWPPAVAAGEWWRLGTAIFLHIGLWHLLFNLVALAQIGPTIEEIFGRGRMLLFFMITGVAANLGSELLGLQAVSAGASGSLMGMIGLAAGWGQRDGTAVGKTVRNRMLQWGLYTMVFGYALGADNAAHGAGFAVGALLGLLFRPNWLRRRIAALDLVEGLLGALAMLGTVALALFPPSGSFQEWSAEIQMGPIREAYRAQARVCRLKDQGRNDEALQAFQKVLSADEELVAEGQATATPEALASFCEALTEMDRRCQAFKREGLKAMMGQELLPADSGERRRIEDAYRGMCQGLASGDSP